MTYASEVLADSPDIFLKVDETSGTVAADSSGHARDFSAGNVTWAQPSLLADGSGTSIILNGTNAYLSRPNETWMTSASVTCEFRYKHTTSSGARNFIGRWGSAGSKAWLVTVSNNQVIAQIDNSGAILTSTTTLANGAIYTIAFRTDGTTAKLYVNGVEEASVSNPGPTQTGSPFEVGRGALNAYSPTQIDGIAFWASAVSATRLAAHHSAAAGTSGATGTGSLSLSGTAGGAAPASATGAIVLAGTGSGGAPGTPASGAGAIVLDGSASTAGVATASGTLDLAGVVAAANAASGTGFITLSGDGTAVALYLTDTSNAFDGLDLLVSMAVTFVVPIAPAAADLAVKYDKAIAYPTPAMVGGRPT